jgi:hypothetical protein
MDDLLAAERLADLRHQMAFKPGTTIDERTVSALIVAYERLAHEHNVVVARLRGLLNEIEPGGK